MQNEIADLTWISQHTRELRRTHLCSKDGNSVMYTSVPQCFRQYRNRQKHTNFDHGKDEPYFIHDDSYGYAMDAAYFPFFLN